MSDLNEFLEASPKQEEYRKKIFIVYEGRVTEKKYFNSISIKKNINLIDCGDTPMCKVDRLNSLVKAKGYEGDFSDEKIYVLDFDIIESDGHKLNIYDYLDSDFVVYYTNPCFELWLLYHFETDENVMKTIRKDRIVTYTKRKEYLEFSGGDNKDLTETDIIELKNRIPDAIEFAKKIGIEYKQLTKENLETILQEINLTNLDILLNEIAA